MPKRDVTLFEATDAIKILIDPHDNNILTGLKGAYPKGTYETFSVYSGKDITPTLDIIEDVVCAYFGVEDVSRGDYPAIVKQFISYFTIHYNFPRKPTAELIECTPQYISQLSEVVSRSIGAKDISYTKAMDSIWDKLENGA